MVDDLGEEFADWREQALALGGQDPVVRRKLEELPRSGSAADLHYATALCHRALGHFERERDHLHLALEAEPAHREALYALGYWHAERGQYEAAALHLSALVKEKPGDTTAWYGLGVATARLKRYDEAIPALERARELGQEGPDLHAVLSVSYFERDQWQSCVEHGERSLAYPTMPLNKNSVRTLMGRAYWQLGDASSDAGEHAQALEYFQRSVKVTPALAESWYAVGRELAYLQRWHEAAPPLRRALELGYSETSCLVVLMDVLFHTGDWEEIERAADRLLELDPDPEEQASRHLVLAALCRVRKDGSGMLHHQREAVRLTPHDPIAAYNLGVTYYAWARFEAAVPELERAVQHAYTPDDRHEFTAVLGQALLESGDYDRARSLLSPLLGTERHDDAFSLLLDAGVRLGELGEAEAAARTELAARPQSGAAHAALGYVLLHLGQDDEAHQYLAAAWRLQPDSPWVQWLAGGRFQKSEWTNHGSREPASQIPEPPAELSKGRRTHRAK